MRITTLLSFAAVLFVSANAAGQDLPPALEELVAGYEADAEEGTRVEVWRFEYKGQSVFYLPLARALCCDVMSELYDAAGELLCRPDGGYTGRGDGKCPDFFEERTAGQLMWRGSALSVVESRRLAESDAMHQDSVE